MIISQASNKHHCIPIIDDNFNYTKAYTQCSESLGELGFEELERWLYSEYRAKYVYHPMTRFAIELEFEEPQAMLLFLLRYS